jgi:hypothetical protein
MNYTTRHNKLENQVLDVIEKHLARTTVADIKREYMNKKPRYIPKVIYWECLKSFLSIEYYNP